jgi:hypothetical protein
MNFFMKYLGYIVAVIVIFIMQIVNSGAEAAVHAVVSWDPNPAEEGVTFYRLQYRVENSNVSHVSAIQSRKDNQCITMDENGDTYALGDCRQLLRQKFNFIPSAQDGRMLIQSRHTGECMQFTRDGNDVPLTSGDCVDDIGQRFEIVNINDYMRINSRNGVLDAHAQNRTIVQWQWADGQNQHWFYSEWSRPADWFDVDGNVSNETNSDGRILVDEVLGHFNPGTRICFRIQARNPEDTSPWSNESCAIVSPVIDDNGNNDNPVATVTVTAPTGITVILERR